MINWFNFINICWQNEAKAVQMHGSADIDEMVNGLNCKSWTWIEGMQIRVVKVPTMNKSRFLYESFEPGYVFGGLYSNMVRLHV